MLSFENFLDLDIKDFFLGSYFYHGNCFKNKRGAFVFRDAHQKILFSSSSVIPLTVETNSDKSFICCTPVSNEKYIERYTPNQYLVKQS